MEQKVETYINKDLWEIAYYIKEEIKNYWFVVSIIGEGRTWLVVYEKDEQFWSTVEPRERS